MKLWIGRDDYGLWLFVKKPVKSIIYGDIYFIKRGNISYSIDSNLFPEVTSENSPQEVKIELAQEINALDLFKKLPHLNDNKEVVDDWGYTPNLYHFDTMWHVSWMHCEDGYELIGFDGETPEEAIQKAFDWCVELKLIHI